MKIDFNSEIPIYIQISLQIEDSILSGTFAEDTQIPSTTEISTLYKINPATVLKGMTLLTDEGILYKKRGVGMFVKQGALEAICQKRKKSFYRDYILRMLEEANKLNINTDEIMSMITKGIES